MRWLEQERQPWDVWLRTWRAHAETEAFARKLQRALDVMERAKAISGQLFVAVSGGKDSVATAAVVVESGLRLPAVHCFTELEVPGMESVSAETCERLGLELTVAEPEEDIWAWLREVPEATSILEAKTHERFCCAFASGNMLVAQTYAAGYAGSVSGLRSDESKGRRANRRVRGPIYQLLSDETWMVLPIVDWSARDVFAMCVARDLPIHPHYRRLLERFGISPESPCSRVDNVLTEDGIAARGSMVHLRALYPELWKRLSAVRPELWREVT